MPTTPLRLRALETMLDLTRQPVREQGANNRGPVVDRIIDYAGGQRGEPWCVDGVIYAYGKSGSRAIAPGFPRAVRLMLVAGKTRRIVVPRPGDVVRYVFDHTGLFVGWRRRIGARYVKCPRLLATHIMAAEANTGADGARSDGGDGHDGAFVRYRHRSLVDDYLAVLS